uniref:Histone deacetylase domain-containing protein n=1 Tax=Astyanax mexicanus TaxID=7994 RepID=A0A8B9RJ42_ASTMX
MTYQGFAGFSNFLEEGFKPLSFGAHSLFSLLLQDIHHAEIVQNVFYTDPKVLYISLHRKDTLSPARGGPTDVGSGDAVGFNVNVPWSDKLETIGDAEYLAAFRTVVLPIGRQFSPDVVLVSSEFNAVDGHPASSGGHRVSANCFGFLTQRLMDLAKDRVVLVLEGGHDIMAICDASEACVKALLKYKFVAPSEDVLKKRPCAKAVQCLQKVLRIQSEWRCAARGVCERMNRNLAAVLSSKRASCSGSDSSAAARKKG